MRDAVTNGLEPPGPIDRIIFMSTQPNPPLPSGGPTAPEVGSVPSLARRRLLRGGLGAAPVLMAAAPRSVMASGTCMTGSLYTSFSPNTTVSRSPTTFNCTGKTPAGWVATPTASWPSSCKEADGTTPIKFHPLFADATGSTPYGTKTLLEVLQLTATTGPDCLAKHLAAAMLNAGAGLTPVTVADRFVLQTVWKDYRGKGYYEPTAGVWWGCDAPLKGTGAITPWLKSTMVG
jgi:hypothetical protein